MGFTAQRGRRTVDSRINQDMCAACAGAGVGQEDGGTASRGLRRGWLLPTGSSGALPCTRSVSGAYAGEGPRPGAPGESGAVTGVAQRPGGAGRRATGGTGWELGRAREGR